MEVLPIIGLLTAHWVADFVLQSDEMATNKSSSNPWLAYHVGVYSLVMCLFGLGFAMANGILHFITDYITSRMTSKAWKEEKRHRFFVIIGADQLIHTATLITLHHFMT